MLDLYICGSFLLVVTLVAENKPGVDLLVGQRHLSG